jgi:hypothetical protein
VEFNLFLNVLMTYLIIPANKVRMGFADTTEQGKWLIGTFLPIYGDYVEAYRVWVNPENRTPVITANLLGKEKAMKKILRELYKGFLKDTPIVTDNDLESMGLPKRESKKRTPSPKADTSPWAKVILSRVATIIIKFSAEIGKRGKLFGQHDVECCWVISDAPITNWNDLVRSSFSTKSPLVLVFDGDMRGKTIYFALRWRNTRGEMGPFGPIMNAMIP